MKKIIVFIVNILILGIASVQAWDDDPLEPGSYFNPYVIERNFLTGEYEIKAKYPTGDFEKDIKPGGYLNPYVIKRNIWGEWEIKPKIWGE